MTADNTFHGYLDRQVGAMGVLEERIAEVSRTHAGRPEAEVFDELQRVHDQMGLQLDPTGGLTETKVRELQDGPRSSPGNGQEVWPAAQAGPYLLQGATAEPVTSTMRSL